MKDTRLIMGMPIEIEVVESDGAREALEEAFAHFTSVDERFSPYKTESEVSRFGRGEVHEEELSTEFQEVLKIAEETKKETNGFFDIKRPDGTLDPSGVVKGWAIKNAAARLRAAGFEHFFVNAGGDVAVSGKNAEGDNWSVGIENPFNRTEIVKVVYPKGAGMATSGSYIRGAHIYNPHDLTRSLDDVVSITVIAGDVMRADLLATAAFAMGKDGIAFIDATPDCEGYHIDAKGVATLTRGFSNYTV